MHVLDTFIKPLNFLRNRCEIEGNNVLIQIQI